MNMSSTALSGMRVAQSMLNASAHNIANVNTPHAVRQTVLPVSEPMGGVSATLAHSPGPADSLASDVVTQLQAKNAFIANLAVFKVANQLQGTLLDKSA